MVLKFQFLLSLVAPKYYCVCGWTLECASSAGLLRPGWLITGVLPPNAAERCVTFGRGPQYIVQPRARDCICFLFYVISAVFTVSFIVFLPPTVFFFKHCCGVGEHSVMSSLAHREEGGFLLSAAQSASKPLTLTYLTLGLSPLEL